jgi:hypothetical protein
VVVVHICLVLLQEAIACCTACASSAVHVDVLVCWGWMSGADMLTSLTAVNKGNNDCCISAGCCTVQASECNSGSPVSDSLLTSAAGIY